MREGYKHTTELEMNTRELYTPNDIEITASISRPLKAYLTQTAQEQGANVSRVVRNILLDHYEQKQGIK